eukprot:Skav206157  [mRNA]  locus=scaffold1545:168839:169291:- [translate_table: standard]
MELKAACRQRINKIEQSKLDLQVDLEERLKELDVLRSALKKQEDSTETSRAKMLQCRAEAEAAETDASLALQAMQQIHEEWGQAQKQHAQLEDALMQMKKDLQAEIENESQALLDWRQKHMQHLDAKLEAKRAREFHLRHSEPMTVPSQP